MPDSSVFQNDFRGGEWSSTSQARSDDPAYKTALKVGQNMLPLEEGSATRRPSFQRMGPMRNRLKPKLLDFMSSSTCAFVCEFTNLNLQFWSGTLPIFTSDGAVTTVASFGSSLITLTFAAFPGSPQWAVGDVVMFKFEGAGLSVAQEAFCRGRFFQITARNVGGHTITLGDDQGNTFTLSTFPAGSLVGITVYRVLRFTTTYTGASVLSSLRLVQAQTQAFVLSSTVAPQVIVVNEPNAPNDPTFTFGAVTFLDGPYLDPQPDAATLSALSGSVTLTAASSTFVAADVGRMIRVYTQPAAWNSGSTYAAGAFVTYNGGYWLSIASGLYVASNVNVIPGTPLYTAGGIQVPLWVPAPQAFVVVWGTISSRTGTTATFTVQLVDGVTAPPAGNVVQQWQLGVYTAATYPTCGVYYEGRVHLGGAVQNRGDASMANGIAQSPLTNAAGVAMSPTDQNGNINDNCGISYVLNSDHLNNFEWMIADQQGIVIGTLEGEWILAASALGDPITPTSIQVHLATRYGGAFVEPRRAGIAMLFVQRYGRRVLEYLADTFSQRFSGLHVNDHSKHMTLSGVAELRYQEEAAPLIWTAQNDGSLASCTYRRRSRFVTENPLFNGWMRHQHGAPGGSVASIVTLPAGNDLGDNLYAAIGTQYGYWMEVLRELPEVNDTATGNRYLDSRQGNGANEIVLSKCGSLVPSSGISIPPSTYTPNVWSPAPTFPGSHTPPNTVLSATAPANPIGIQFVQASRFNAASLIYNLAAASSLVSSGSISVWFWLDNVTSGAIYNTGPPNAAGIPIFQDQASSGNFASILNASPGGTVFPSGWGSFSGLTGGWHHLMLAWANHQGTASEAIAYIDDTLIGRGTQDVFNAPAGSCDFSQLAFGGHSFWGSGRFQAGTYGQQLRGMPQIPAPKEGLKGDVYDLWILLSGNFSEGSGACAAIDWSVSANRYLFHNANGAKTRYAPCALGSQGQAPLAGGLTTLTSNVVLTSTVPSLYCTGAPASFNQNLANGANISCYNGNPAVNNARVLLDPALHKLPVV